MFRRAASTFLSRATATRRFSTHVATPAAATRRFSTDVDVATPAADPPTPSTPPTKLSVSFVLPYSSPLAPKEVDMITVPAAAGEMGVLPGHVPAINELKPGVLSVHEGNDTTKYFVSSGFVFIYENSAADIIALDVVPLDQIDASEVQKGLQEFTQKLNSATTELEKAEAQIGVDVHTALNSALEENI